MNHDHTCYCGGIDHSHRTGEDGCFRFMVPAPDMEKASEFTYKGRGDTISILVDVGAVGKEAKIRQKYSGATPC